MSINNRIIAIIGMFNRLQANVVKQIIGLVLLVLFAESLCAQTGYEIRFPANGFQSACQVVENEDGILFSTAYCKLPNTMSVGKLIRISHSGDTTSVVSGDPGFNINFHSLYLSDSGNILVFGSRSPDPGVNDTAYFTISSYSNSLTFLWKTEFALPFEYSDLMTIAIVEDTEANLVITGNALAKDPNAGSRNDVFLATFNTHTNKLSMKFLRQQGNEYVYDLYFEEDSLHYKISAEGFSLNSKAQILTLDTCFQILRITDLHPIIAGPVNFNWKSPDKILLTSVFHKPLGSSYDTRIDLVSLNQSLTFQNNQYWDMDDTYDVPAWRGGLETTGNSEYVIGGTFNTCFFSTRSWLMLAKTDSLFNKVWQRYYGGDAHYVMYKMIATKDGGYVMVGNYCDTLAPDRLGIYVLKVNSDGFVSNIGEEKAKDQPIFLYPNPAKDYLYFRTALNSPVDFKLYDLTGQLVLEDKAVKNSGKFNVESLHPGIYIYKCSIKGTLIHCGKIIIH